MNYEQDLRDVLDMAVGYLETMRDEYSCYPTDDRIDAIEDVAVHFGLMRKQLEHDIAELRRIKAPRAAK